MWPGHLTLIYLPCVAGITEEGSERNRRVYISRGDSQRWSYEYNMTNPFKMRFKDDFIEAHNYIS